MTKCHSVKIFYGSIENWERPSILSLFEQCRPQVSEKHDGIDFRASPVRSGNRPLHETGTQGQQASKDTTVDHTTILAPTRDVSMPVGAWRHSHGPR